MLARVTRKAPKKFVSKIGVIRARLLSTSAPDIAPMPALLTTSVEAPIVRRCGDRGRRCRVRDVEELEVDSSPRAQPAQASHPASESRAVRYTGDQAGELADDLEPDATVTTVTRPTRVSMGARTIEQSQCVAGSSRSAQTRS